MISIIRRFAFVIFHPLVVQILGWITLLQRALFGTVQGALIFSIFLYWYMEHFGSTKPFTSAQLAIWASELSAEATAGVLTSFITVLGFLIAFRAATANWKDQTRTTIRIAAADEIETFFDEFVSLVLDAQIFVENTLDERERLVEGNMNPESSTLVSVHMENAIEFIEKRKRMSVMSVKMYRLASKHYSILHPFAGAIEALKDCEIAADEVTKKMWIKVATLDPSAPGNRTLFLNQIDVKDWREFAQCCDTSYDRINGLVALLRSMLFSSCTDRASFIAKPVPEPRCFAKGFIAN